MCCIIIATAASSRLPPRGRNCLLRELPSFFFIFIVLPESSSLQQQNHRKNWIWHIIAIECTSEREECGQMDLRFFFHCKQREVEVIWVKRTAMASWRWLRNDLHSCDVRLWARLHVVRCLFQRVFSLFFYWFQELRVSLSPSEFRCAKWKVHFHEKFISSFTPRQASTIRIFLVVCCVFLFCVLHNKTCRQKVICEISSLLGNCTRCRVMENRNFISHILRHTTHIAIAFNAVLGRCMRSSLRETSKIKRATHNAQLQFIN